MLEKLTKESAFTQLPKDVQETILKYGKPCVGFDSKIAEKCLPLTASKFGGVPFIADGEDVPRDDKGRPYFMVVQLNFAEIREQAGQHYELPETGLLQIFVDGFDMNYGLVSTGGKPHNPSPQIVKFFKTLPDIETNNKTVSEEYRNFIDGGADFKVQEKLIGDEFDWENSEKKVKELPFSIKYGYPYFPVLFESELTFKAELSLPIESSVELCFEEANKLWESIGESGKNYVENTTCQHRLVGLLKQYRTGDPRYVDFYPDDAPPELEKFTDECGNVIRTDLQVFLELDSDYMKEGATAMRWWDCAQAHFLIKHEDLIQQNFNNMEFHVEA